VVVRSPRGSIPPLSATSIVFVSFRFGPFG